MIYWMALVLYIQRCKADPPLSWVEREPFGLFFVGVWASSGTMVSVISSFQDAAIFSVFPDGCSVGPPQVRSLLLAADVLRER